MDYGQRAVRVDRQLVECSAHCDEPMLMLNSICWKEIPDSQDSLLHWACAPGFRSSYCCPKCALVLSMTKAEVTFATAAAGSPKSTATSNYTAAAVFPRSHNVAVTYVYIFRVAAWRIYKLWRPKAWGCRTAFDLMSHGDLRASLRRP